MFSAMGEVLTSENLIFLLKGAGLSLAMAVLSLLIGLVLGTLGASAKISKNRILRCIGNVYVEIIRGTPMLLQILILFAVVPLIYMEITGERLVMNVFLIGVIAMGINSGAYVTELIRSGINGVDKGQWEACETLGLTRGQTMKLVILPQAFKRIVPPLVSEFVTLIKDSSLVSTIGVVELLKSAQVLGGNYADLMSPLIIAGVMYLIMTLSIAYLARHLERRLAESDEGRSYHQTVQAAEGSR